MPEAAAVFKASSMNYSSLGFSGSIGNGDLGEFGAMSEPSSSDSSFSQVLEQQTEQHNNANMGSSAQQNSQNNNQQSGNGEDANGKNGQEKAESASDETEKAAKSESDDKHDEQADDKHDEQAEQGEQKESAKKSSDSDAEHDDKNKSSEQGGTARLDKDSKYVKNNVLSAFEESIAGESLLGSGGLVDKSMLVGKAEQDTDVRSSKLTAVGDMAGKINLKQEAEAGAGFTGRNSREDARDHNAQDMLQRSVKMAMVVDKSAGDTKQFSQILNSKSDGISVSGLQLGKNLTAVNKLATAGTQQNTPSNFTVNTPVQTKAWGQAVGDKIMLMANQNRQVAEIQLNPKHMGPMEVRITVENGQTNVAFTSNHVAVREALENAMPKLREMMEESGMSLVDVDVSQHSFSKQKQMADNQSDSNANDAGEDGSYADNNEGTSGVDDHAIPLTTKTSLGIVDYYA